MTLTAQQFCLAKALVKPRYWRSTSMAVMSYLEGATFHDELIGAAGEVQVSANTIAERVGKRPGSIRAELVRLAELGILGRSTEGSQSGAAADVWWLNLDPASWDTEVWSKPRPVALALIANSGFATPWGVPKRVIFRTPVSVSKRGGPAVIARLRSQHRGDFLPRFSAYQDAPPDGTPQGDSKIPGRQAGLPSSRDTSYLSDEQQQQRGSINSPGEGARAIHALVREVAGVSLHSGPWESVMAAAGDASAADVAPLLDELRRVGQPGKWRGLVELAVDWLRNGPPTAVIHVDRGRVAALTREVAQLEAEVDDMRAKGYPVDDELERLDDLRGQLAGACEDGSIERGATG